MLCIASLHTMNVQRSLIQKLVLYEFELIYNATRTTKIIYGAKDGGEVNQSRATRRLKKFRSGSKKFYD